MFLPDKNSGSAPLRVQGCFAPAFVDGYRRNLTPSSRDAFLCLELTYSFLQVHTKTRELEKSPRWVRNAKPLCTGPGESTRFNRSLIIKETYQKRGFHGKRKTTKPAKRTVYAAIPDPVPFRAHSPSCRGFSDGELTLTSCVSPQERYFTRWQCVEVTAGKRRQKMHYLYKKAGSTHSF